MSNDVMTVDDVVDLLPMQRGLGGWTDDLIGCQLKVTIMTASTGPVLFDATVVDRRHLKVTLP